MSNYPRGKLNAEDEGELTVRITVKDKTVIVDFGKGVTWLGLGAVEARALGRKLIERANEASPPDRPKKPILCLDFDGVIHRYSKGWQDGSIYDDAVPGFFEFAEAASEVFHLVVYSSRSKTEAGQMAMALWMTQQRAKWREAGGKSTTGSITFEYADEKPPAFVTIDDRAVTFKGEWPDPSELSKFKPWNVT